MMMTKELFTKAITMNTSLYDKVKAKAIEGFTEIENMKDFEGWDFEVDSIQEYMNCLFSWDEHSLGKDFWYSVYNSFKGR